MSEQDSRKSKVTHRTTGTCESQFQCRTQRRNRCSISPAAGSVAYPLRTVGSIDTLGVVRFHTTLRFESVSPPIRASRMANSQRADKTCKKHCAICLIQQRLQVFDARGGLGHRCASVRMERISQNVEERLRWYPYVGCEMSWKSLRGVDNVCLQQYEQSRKWAS